MSALKTSLQVNFDNLHQLYRAYMPFVTHGALFIATGEPLTLGDQVTVRCLLPDMAEASHFEATVVWINPQGAQGSRPAGVGVQFANKDDPTRSLIETQLSHKLASVELTSTM